jgi:hypothetical protein
MFSVPRFLASCTLTALALTHPLSAQTEGPETSAVKGINPADNLSKFEVLPKFSHIDDDTSITTTTLKYDRALHGVYGLNVELPLARFDSPFADDTGIGDLNIRGRRQFRDDRWTYIGGLEAVLPIASADTLGSGKFQLNPTFVAVYALSGQTFVAAVAKHVFSVAGESNRADIVQGQYRVLLAHSTRSGWWYLADPQYAVDYHQGSRSQLSFDLEVGKMVRPLTGVWLRAGSRLGGSWHKEDWSVSGGVRVIFF